MKTWTAIAIAAVIPIVGGCKDEKRESPAPPTADKSPNAAAAQEIAATVGKMFTLAGPGMPVHPDFAGATVEAEFDRQALTLERSELDTAKLGASTKVFSFRPIKPGVTRVVLSVKMKDGTIERSTAYSLKVSG